MEVELLWNDSKKQDSLIYESVMAIRTNLQIVRENLTTRHTHGHEDPTSGNNSR
jgi:hypothetical protein